MTAIHIHGLISDVQPPRIGVNAWVSRANFHVQCTSLHDGAARAAEDQDLVALGNLLLEAREDFDLMRVGVRHVACVDDGSVVIVANLSGD